MKRFFQKKILKSSSKKQSTASLNSYNGEDFCGYHIDLGAVDSSFTKLHKACWLGDEDRARAAAKKVDVSFQDNESRSPLHLAAARGHMTVVQLLLRSHARVDALDSEGKTPLMKAVEGQHREVVRCLLEQRANPDVPDQNLDTALHLALSTGQPDMALLLVQFDADVLARNKEGMSPLYLAVLQQHLDVARVLLDKGAMPNAGDNQKKTPLMVACEAGSVPLVQLLMSRGASVGAIDQDGRSAMDYATRAGKEECCKVLAGTGTPRRMGGDAINGDLDSWKSSTDSEASEKQKRLPFNTRKASSTRSSQKSNADQPISLNGFNGVGSAKFGRSFSVETGSSNHNRQSSDGPLLQTIALAPPDKLKQVEPQAAESRDVPGEPHFKENDIGSWLAVDDSVEEDPDEEAKVTSLYIPSASQKRKPEKEDDFHKSVEVLLAYEGQQLTREAATKSADGKNAKKAGNGEAVVGKAESVNASRSPESSDWDSTEGVATLPRHQVASPPQEGTLGRVDTLQGTEEIWEKNPILPPDAEETPKHLATPELDPQADEDDAPQRPPRFSKNRLRSSWSSSSSSSVPSRTGPLVVGGSGRRGATTKKEGEDSEAGSSSPQPDDAPRTAANGNVVGETRGSPKASSRDSREKENALLRPMKINGRSGSDPEALVATLQMQVNSAKSDLQEQVEQRKVAESLARELQLQLSRREEAIMRDVETKDTIDGKLADLEQELKSAKGLIKDLHHEIESLQKQLNCYKESADVYKEASEKQENLFKELLSEKEKFWAEEREKMLAQLKEKDALVSTAQTTTEFLTIQEKLVALHEVLASLNLKADATCDATFTADGISKLLQLSNSALGDLQKLSESAEHTTSLLRNIDENLQGTNDRKLGINQLLEASQKLEGLSSWTQNCDGIGQTLERLETNQKALTNTLGELQSLLATGNDSGSLLRQKEESGNLEASDLSDIKEGVTRVLRRLDRFADEIKMASSAEGTKATQKVVESFSEYHSSTKQEMLNLLNKVSCEQKAQVDRVVRNTSGMSEEFAEIRLNQSTALKQLQSLKDELIQMDTSGMFARLESSQEKSAQCVTRMVEPVSAELKSMQATLQRQHEELVTKISEPAQPGVAPEQWQGVIERLDCLLDQTSSLQAKERAGRLERLSADLREVSPENDLPTLLGGLTNALADLKGEVRRQQGPGFERRASLRMPGDAADHLLPQHRAALARNNVAEESKLEKEKYRSKKALLKYKSELKGIKEKLKNINHICERDGLKGNRQIDQQASDLQRRIDMLALRIDSDRQYRTDLEISNLRTEMHHIRQGLSREELHKSLPSTYRKLGHMTPSETPTKLTDYNGCQNMFHKYRTDLTEEVHHLRRNLGSEPDVHYSWLSTNNTPENHNAEVATGDTYSRKQLPGQSQSTPHPVPLFAKRLPSWSVSPVKSAPPVPAQSTSTRQRVQAMLDESLARHLTPGNSFVAPPHEEYDSVDAELKKSLAELTNSLEKTYLV